MHMRKTARSVKPEGKVANMFCLQMWEGTGNQVHQPDQDLQRVVLRQQVPSRPAQFKHCSMAQHHRGKVKAQMENGFASTWKNVLVSTGVWESNSSGVLFLNNLRLLVGFHTNLSIDSLDWAETKIHLFYGTALSIIWIATRHMTGRFWEWKETMISLYTSLYVNWTAPWWKLIRAFQ
jgi:hypothetical protein